MADYRHDERRLNNPPAGLVSYETAVREPRRQTYAYDPHLSPQLIWAGKPGLKSIEVEDAAGVEVDEVALHVHERVSTRAIIEAVQRPEPKQLGLFADPDLPLSEAVQFYQHEQDWANRLILGDSLLVMNSLLTRELMGGKVQMIYLDPPYGVKFASNFQPRIDERDVRDGDEHLTREPEMVKAFRDTWTLGVHSYLTYLRDRLRVARDLLADSGSIFVQIGDENVHHVRELMDDIFGSENFCRLITFFKTTSQTSTILASTVDYLLWYAKDRDQVSYRQLNAPKTVESDEAGVYSWLESSDGRRRRMTTNERNGSAPLPEGARVFRLDNMVSQSGGETTAFDVELDGKNYTRGRGYWKTNRRGMDRLIPAERVTPSGGTLAYVRYIEDFPVAPLANLWTDTGTGSFTDQKVYVVQTGTKVVQRCILMTTDPGDLVLDPTCGSGTTAYVAEQWGRRWITIDTSRVALALARQRILTATFPYYRLSDPDRGVAGGFVYKTVPHIQLKDYAQNTRIAPVVERYGPEIEAAEKTGDAQRLAELKRRRREEIDRVVAEDAEPEVLYDQPEIERGIVRVSGPFTVEAIPPAALEIQEASPIGGEPEPDDATGPAGDLVRVTSGSDDARDAGSHIPRLIADLARDGVTFPDNRVLRLASLSERHGGILHAEGEAAEEAEVNRVAVSFGPQHGAVSMRQVEDALYEARRGGFDAVIFCGFAFQAEAQAFISENRDPRLKAFLAYIRPDTLLVDDRGQSLLKTTASSQLFAVFGEPEVELHRRDNGNIEVELLGVDVYDPIEGQVHSARPTQIAAWFLDTDYDGRTFCICQAFFPNRSAWDRLSRALKGRIDEEALEMLSGTISLPFPAGRHERVAVKVIDQRGNEVMRVLHLSSLSHTALRR